jgi:UDP-N-acetyl-D-glucosamine dehydrogenase
MGSKIAIIGLGYVGLPLARLFLQHGHTVFGIDLDERKIDKLAKRQSYLSDFTRGDIREMFALNRFQVGTSYALASEAQAVIICVPTPIDEHAQPDLTYVRGAVSGLLPHLRKEQLVVLESSTYPGTTEEELLPIIESQGFKVGRDIYLAYSPERIDPGQNRIALRDIPKVVGGVTPACTRLAGEIYGSVFSQIVGVSNPRTAEMTKLLENYQRFVNISLMNDLLLLCRVMDISLWEVVDAAATKPYGFTPYYPGPGIGGHCIPVDPMYLLWKANKYNIELPFIELSHRINERMPEYVLEQIERSLPNSLSDSSVFVIGVTYKKDVNDIRESSALRVMELLQQRGVKLSFYDPYVEELTVSGSVMTRTPLTARQVKGHDCSLILTDHSNVPYALLAEHAPLVLDTRNTFGRSQKPSNVVLL